MSTPTSKLVVNIPAKDRETLNALSEAACRPVGQQIIYMIRNWQEPGSQPAQTKPPITPSKVKLPAPVPIRSYVTGEVIENPVNEDLPTSDIVAIIWQKSLWVRRKMPSFSKRPEGVPWLYFDDWVEQNDSVIDVVRDLRRRVSEAPEPELDVPLVLPIAEWEVERLMVWKVRRNMLLDAWFRGEVEAFTTVEEVNARLREIAAGDAE